MPDAPEILASSTQPALPDVGHATDSQARRFPLFGEHGLSSEPPHSQLAASIDAVLKTDYGVEGLDRYKTMTLATHEFIRRFLTHVLPKGLHDMRRHGSFGRDDRQDGA